MPEPPLRLLAPASQVGDLFTELARDLFESLGYEILALNVGTARREIDIQGRHRGDPNRLLYAECKATAGPIGGAALDKFAGSLYAERRGKVVEGYVVSLAGFTGPALAQEEQFKPPRFSLMNATDVVAALERGRRIAAQRQILDRAGRCAARLGTAFSPDPPQLLGHPDLGWVWAVVYRRGGKATHVALLLGSDGEPLDTALAKLLLAADSEGPLGELSYLGPPDGGPSAAEVAMPRIDIELGDIFESRCDVLILKYAQDFYGADAAAANVLAKFYRHDDMMPRPGSYVLLPSHGQMAARNVLFVGVVDLDQFDYGQIRSFSYLALQILSHTMAGATTLAMTIHGPGYGLDERESFLALLAGIEDAFHESLHPPFLKNITIVERNEGRSQRLKALLSKIDHVVYSTKSPESLSHNPSIDAGQASSAKPHVFVAMPFSEGLMEDVYGFGIQGPVNSAGYLCERVDLTTFTGSIMERVHNRIDSAALVIADLTDANPNVYLEVGYAWGRGKPTLLLINQESKLMFDVSSQRCLRYKNITDLSRKLTADLKVLLAGSQ